MKIASTVIHLFYPKRCIVCGYPVRNLQELICDSCFQKMIFSDSLQLTNNTITKKIIFSAHFIHGGSLCLYDKEGICQKLIHQLKYKKRQDIGVYFGHLICSQLEQSIKYKNVELVVPVPLHPSKENIRGYNQMDTLGTLLAEKLGIKYVKDFLIRVKKSESQTTKNKTERYLNVASSFKINPVYKNATPQHILIIDDVITTGATLSACIKTLNIPHHKVSFLSIASVE